MTHRELYTKTKRRLADMERLLTEDLIDLRAEFKETLHKSVDELFERMQENEEAILQKLEIIETKNTREYERLKKRMSVVESLI